MRKIKPDNVETIARLIAAQPAEIARIDVFIDLAQRWKRSKVQTLRAPLGHSTGSMALLAVEAEVGPTGFDKKEFSQ